MTAWRSNLILLALWGMDLSWLYGWAGVPMLAAFGRPFPQAGAIVVSGLAVLLTRLIRGRGWRNYHVAGIHLLGLLLACAAVLYTFVRQEQPFFGSAWLVDLSAQPKSPGEWLLLVLVTMWSVVFWVAGVRLALIPRDHNTVSNHFDAGIIAFVLLHLLEVLLEVKGGIVLVELSLPRVFLAFFLFAVLAFCLARCQGEGKSDFLAGFRGIGVVLGFACLVILLGSGLVALFLPVLTAAATAGVAALETAATPAGVLLVKILTYFLGHGRVRPGTAAPSGKDDLFQALSAFQPEGLLLLLQKVAVFLAIASLLLLFLTLFVLLVWQLIWWLGQRTGKEQSGPSPWQRFSVLIAGVAAGLTRYFRRLSHRQITPADPVSLYMSLTVWGRRSGLTLQQAETPEQYGLRLSRRFPALKEDIRLIIAVHDKAVYGGRSSANALDEAHLASKRMNCLRFWANRLHSLLFR